MNYGCDIRGQADPLRYERFDSFAAPLVVTIEARIAVMTKDDLEKVIYNIHAQTSIYHSYLGKGITNLRG